MILKLENLQCGYKDKIVVDRFSTVARSGEILCILGPNGVGKTTLFKTILGHLPRMDGKICVGEESSLREIQDLSQKEKARYISYVPQAHSAPFAFLVEDVVTLGRIAHLGVFASPTAKDLTIARQAMEELGITYLAKAKFTEISGGERQMVLIARALAQESSFMVMDEPTSNLDFGNQVRVMQTVRRLAKKGLGIIMTTHFPDHAFLCDARVVLMMRGNRILQGTASEVVTEENLMKAYQVPVSVAQLEINGKTQRFCQPMLTEE